MTKQELKEIEERAAKATEGPWTSHRSWIECPEINCQNSISPDIYEDNLRQIISIASIHGMTTIVATLPELDFTPLYLKNKNFIKQYNKVIRKLSRELSFKICDMTGIESFYIDGVHFKHVGNLEIADRFYKTILKLQGDD